MKNLIISLLLVSSITTRTAAQGQTDTIYLSRVVDLALQNNQAIKIAELEKQKAVFQHKASQSMLMPQVEAYSTFSYYYAIPKIVIPGEIFGQQGNIPVEFGTKYDWNNGFRFTQLIYNQSYFTNLQIVDEIIKIQDFNTQLKKEEVVFQISQLYYLCQTIDWQISVVDSTLKQMQKLIEIVKKLQINGLARQADVERVIIDVRKIEIQKQELASHFQQQLFLLKLLTGLDPDAKVQLSKALPVPLELADSAVYKRTELLILEKRKELVALQVKAEKQSQLPSLALFGQHFYQGMRDEFDFFDGGKDRFFRAGIVGFQLNVPIFDGFLKRNQVRLKEIELKQVQEQSEQLKLFDLKERNEALTGYKTHLEELGKLSENIKSAQQIYQSNLWSYQQQVISLTDLIISESQLAEIQMQYYGTIFKLLSSELTLKKINGKLLINNN
jgi:outer membrane protein TolC